jgi:hypothetical protein
VLNFDKASPLCSCEYLCRASHTCFWPSIYLVCSHTLLETCRHLRRRPAASAIATPVPHKTISSWSLIVLPVTVKRTLGGQYDYQKSSGGLVSGTSGLSQDTHTPYVTVGQTLRFHQQKQVKWKQDLRESTKQSLSSWKKSLHASIAMDSQVSSPT